MDQQPLNFRSDDIEPQPAYNELVDLIELLEYLEEQKLVRKYHPAATNVMDYVTITSISLGDSQSQKSVKFSPKDGDRYADFIKQNENYRFCALQPLKALVDRNFLSAEEQRHHVDLQMARQANRTTVIVAITSLFVTTFLGIASILFTMRENEKSNNELLIHIGNLSGRIKSLAIQQRQDSLNYHSFTQEHANVKTELNEIKKEIAALGKIKVSPSDSKPNSKNPH